MLFPFYLVKFNLLEGYYVADDIHFLVLKITAIIYSAYHIFLIELSKRKSKIELFLEGVKNKKFTLQDRKNIRYTLVKFFFIPLMLPSAIIYFKLFLNLFTEEFIYTGFIQLFNKVIFTFVIYGVSFVTLAFYAFGYLFESEKLNSEVKSVDSTFFGWVVLLVCYVPFFVFITQYIPFPTQDYAFFINEEVTFIIRLILSLVMLFKMYVVVSLGAKCSNLTNRGIVTSGAYSYVRHPHYLAKLIIWWITFLPFFIYNLWAVGPMIFWTVVYVLRAITEEKHLSKDEEYRIYKSKVRWMFIPRVF